MNRQYISRSNNQANSNQSYPPAPSRLADQHRDQTSETEGGWTYRDWLTKVIVPLLVALIGAGVIFGPKLASSAASSSNVPVTATVSTPTLVTVSVPHLHLSYSGPIIAPDATQGMMALSVDAQDQQGNLNARVSYSVSGGQFQCTGKVESNNAIHLSCNNVNDGHIIALNGMVQQDNSIVGTDSLGGNWKVS
ncbi:MAG: hypothetical protein PVS3B3_28680 [Ktedonobacteraceae bacterium]